MFLSSLISVCGVLFLSSLATEAFQYGKVQNYCRVQVPGRRGDDLGGRVVFMEENLRYRMPVTSLEVKRNSFDVNMDIDALEREAVQASENWGVFATTYLNDQDARKITERLDNRADIGYIAVGSMSTSLPTLSSRIRIVATNPDLELDVKETEKEYCSMLRIDSISTAALAEETSKSKPWPQLFLRIGVDLKDVGDVVIEKDNDCAYVMVSRDAVRQCIRLLPKELRGVGITISEVEMGEHIPFDGIQQDMELGILDKRSLKYQ